MGDILSLTIPFFGIILLGSFSRSSGFFDEQAAVSYTHLRAHETKANLVCRLLLEKKKQLFTLALILFPYLHHYY